MAWKRRGSKKYFYRNVRQDGRVTTVYYGGGQAGEIAANAVALERAEQKAAKHAERQALDRLDAAIGLNHELSQRGELFATASLLAAGFHRAGRHAWRRWNDGRRILNSTSG